MEPAQHQEPTEKFGGLTIGRDGNVEFERIRKADLEAIPVVVQALDNQWLPHSLLMQALKEGQVTETIERQLRKAVRAEYIRSLINSQQLIINRVFFYNNPTISQDYMNEGSQEREAFKALLEEKVIIPYLLSEESPIDKPIYGLHEQTFARWLKLSQEVRTSCIRLSWDDKENQRLLQRHVHRRFHQFVVGAASGDLDTYIQDLRLDQEAKASLDKVLIRMAQLCLDFNSQGTLITRNTLYKEFVTTGRNPAERHYDNSPLAGAIKQLIDLSYNSNLPDALDSYLIIPVDSPPRTTLQEWQQATQKPTSTANELLTLLQRTTFDLVQRGLNVPSMDILQLSDVQAIRATEEWRGYIQNLQALLKHPERFADGLAAEVYQSYAALAQQIMGRINRQAGKGSLGHAAHALSTGIDFIHFQLLHVQEQWKEIEMEVRKLPGF